MGKVIFQVKNDSKEYNKFILLEKDKNGEYKVKDLIANKQIHIQYYNKIFIEGDFENILNKIELQDIIDYMKKQNIITYINTGFEDIEKFL